MRILYCIPSLYNPGGMERILTDKINFLLDRSNIKVFVVTTDQMNRELFFELHPKASVINLDLDFDSSFSVSMIKKYYAIKHKLKLYKHKLKEIIVQNKVDICISTGGKELEFLYKLNVDCKKAVEMHFAKEFRKQFLVARKNNFIFSLLGDFRTKQLIKQTSSLDAVVVLTEKDQKEWQKTHHNIYQIYNFSPIKIHTKSNSKLKRAIAIGKLDAQKGFDLLIDAWFLKKTQLEEWTLDIFGQGEWKDMLQKKIIDYQLQDNIYLKGVTNNVEAELETSSLFLFSSRYEGFGLVLIEAMSVGLPIVSFDCPHGPSELVIDNGLLVPPQNVEKFSEAIIKLTSDENLRVEMANNGIERAKLFSQEYIMVQWINLFNQLIK